jgi:hypothetical protein
MRAIRTGGLVEVAPMIARLMRRSWRPLVTAGLVGLWNAAPASAQATSTTTPATPVATQQAPIPKPKPYGRVSFYTDQTVIRPDGTTPVTYSDAITSVTFRMPDGEGNGIEYGLEFRQARYFGQGRDARLSIYDAFGGARLFGGRARVRAGQIWLTDLGGLGLFAGGLFEYRAPLSASRLGRLRTGLFYGAEPNPYDAGVVSGLKKFGGYAVIEGHSGRRHSFGYVRLMHSGLLERSVVSATNFLSTKSHVFVYQSAEVDLAGPAGQGHGGLTYLMINARAPMTSRMELQGLYHRGRSVDARGITEDLLSGRPIPAGALDGFLFASAGARVTARVGRDVRLNAGYTRDQNNRDSSATGRITAGGSVSRVARTGVDVTVSLSRMNRPTGQYNSLYVSTGRQFGRLLYLSTDYASSVSILQYSGSSGLSITTRPRMRQVSVSSVLNVNRRVSLLTTWEHTRNDTVSDMRMMSGLTYRFR